MLLAYILASLSGVARWGGCAEDADEEEEDARIDDWLYYAVQYKYKSGDAIRIDKPNERK